MSTNDKLLYLDKIFCADICNSKGIFEVLGGPRVYLRVQF